MKVFSYVDLPKVPNELIEEIYQSIDDKDFRTSYKGYTLYHCKPNLKRFVLDLFGDGFTCAIQAITNEQPIHIDYGRVTAFNYIVELGGNNILTSFYNDLDGQDEIENICIEPFRWHK
jgi:hypothetical protein